MSQKSKQKSRSKSQLEDYASQIFEHLVEFRDNEPDFRPVLWHPLPSDRKKDSLDKELELVKLQKEKLALELEVLRLSQALGPETPPTTSAAPCATGKSDTSSKKRNIDWPQDFVPSMSINTELTSLDLPSFVAVYLAMMRTYDSAANAHMLAILVVSIPIWQSKSNCVDWIGIASLKFVTWRSHFLSIRIYARPILRI